jgi:hypothetical protein
MQRIPPFWRVAFASAVAWISSCSSPAHDQTRIAQEEVALRELPVRAELPYKPQDTSTVVLRDSTAWRAWLVRTRGQAFDPKIDWMREDVVGVVAPEFTDGPTVIDFAGANVARDTVFVAYRLSFPPRRYDYGSQEVGAATIQKSVVEGRVVRFRRLPSAGAEPMHRANSSITKD